MKFLVLTAIMLFLLSAIVWGSYTSTTMRMDMSLGGSADQYGFDLGDAFLLESGDYLLLENGDKLLLE